MGQSLRVAQEDTAVDVGVEAGPEEVVLDDRGIVKELRARPGLIPGRPVVFGHIGAVPVIHCTTDTSGAQIAGDGTLDRILGDAIDVPPYLLRPGDPGFIEPPDGTFHNVVWMLGAAAEEIVALLEHIIGAGVATEEIGRPHPAVCLIEEKVLAQAAVLHLAVVGHDGVLIVVSVPVHMVAGLGDHEVGCTGGHRPVPVGATVLDLICPRIVFPQSFANLHKESRSGVVTGLRGKAVKCSFPAQGQHIGKIPCRLLQQVKNPLAVEFIGIIPTQIGGIMAEPVKKQITYVSVVA